MKVQILFAVLMLLAFAVAKAGGISGGGGKAIVCRNPAGEIISAESLDLYEGRVMYGLNIPKQELPVDDYIKKALLTVPKTNRVYITGYANMVQKAIRFVPEGTQLTPIDDSFEAVFPRGCSAEQLVNYYSDHLVLVSTDIWNHLVNADKAAIILHETIYWMNRNMGATDSRQSRHIVASLFDPSTQWAEPWDGIAADALNCTVHGGALMMNATKKDGYWNLQFEAIGFGMVMSKKTVRFDEADFDLNEAKTFPVLNGEDKIGGSSSGTYALLRSSFEDQDQIWIEKRWEVVTDKTGNVVHGVQTPRYYFNWKSGSYPGQALWSLQLDCSITTGSMSPLKK